MRAARRVDDRLVTDPLDLVPRPLTGVLVLGVDGEIRCLTGGVEAQLDHLPVALVETCLDQRADQVVIVVEVEEPVREPHAIVRSGRPVSVHPVGVLRLGVQRLRLRGVVVRGIADPVIPHRGDAVGVDRRSKEVERQLRLVWIAGGGRGQHAAVGAAQHVSRIVRPL